MHTMPQPHLVPKAVNPLEIVRDVAGEDLGNWAIAALSGLGIASLAAVVAAVAVVGKRSRQES